MEATSRGASGASPPPASSPAPCPIRPPGTTAPTVSSPAPSSPSKGEFRSSHYSSTSGVALTRLGWRAERQFAFFENSLLCAVSIYHNVEADQLVKGRLGLTDGGVAVSRSFLTVRLQPARFLSFDLNHNYFRGVPTSIRACWAPACSTGFCSQGLSGGVRLDLPQRVAVYASLGRNRRKTEARPSWNQMYGTLVSNFCNTGIRIDFRRSAFDSAFGRGAYYTASLSKELNNRLRLDVQGGKQNFRSALTDQHRALFLSSNLEWFLGRHYSVGTGYLIYRGRDQNYDQFFTNIGYRF